MHACLVLFHLEGGVFSCRRVGPSLLLPPDLEQRLLARPVLKHLHNQGPQHLNVNEEDSKRRENLDQDEVGQDARQLNGQNWFVSFERQKVFNAQKTRRS